MTSRDEKGNGLYLPRTMEPSLQAALASFPAVLIDGPRASGKTTTARRYANSVVAFPHDLDRVKVNPTHFLSNLEPPVLIDEWQLAGTDFLWILKDLIDSDPQPGRFILTGSVEPASYGPTYPLTGRATRVMMRPMTLRELNGEGRKQGVIQLLGERRAIQPTSGVVSTFTFADLFRTGFPAARNLSDPSMFLAGYADTVSERGGEEGRDKTRLRRTMDVLAVLEGQSVPDETIWEAADINKRTWKSYEDILTRTSVTGNLRSFESNRLSRVTRYPRRFYADTALSLALAHMSPRDLDGDTTLARRYVESYTVAQVRPQADALGGTVYHLRTYSGGREVDTIIETPVGLIAVEVKTSARPSHTDAANLVWFRELFGQRFLGGILAHTGGDVWEMDDSIFAVPLGQL